MIPNNIAGASEYSAISGTAPRRVSIKFVRMETVTAGGREGGRLQKKEVEVEEARGGRKRANRMKIQKKHTHGHTEATGKEDERFKRKDTRGRYNFAR